ncbi:MAG: hypothetical protein NPIRA01_09730 [Nitrospirales bacterium]|nr:MAG: hypothetical protein NPIRA01_09730 [Nitrospirales bacterium]
MDFALKKYWPAVKIAAQEQPVRLIKIMRFQIVPGGPARGSFKPGFSHGLTAQQVIMKLQDGKAYCLKATGRS